MQEEYFDIVDENNLPTGQVTARQDAHTKGLWHRAVHIYCVRKSEVGVDFLVHLRSKEKGRHPNCWDTRFGGHVKAGETVEEAVLGELEDEAGLAVSLNDLVQADIRVSDHGANREFNYVYFLVGDRPVESLVFQDGEVQEVKWMSADEVLESMQKELDRWSGNPDTFREISEWISEKL
jgi:isopentenyl-diphosphate Delta-isomerase